MRKLFILFIIGIFGGCNLVFADDLDSIDSLWNNYGDTNVYNQKPVSEKEFEKALESKQPKKKKDKNIPKGQSYRESNETEFITKMPNELPVLSIPLELYAADGTVVPIGHYQIMGEKVNGKPVLKLYQAHYLIAKLNAIETQDDFNEKTINFIKLIDYTPKQIKIIYGSVDFNAYAIINTAD